MYTDTSSRSQLVLTVDVADSMRGVGLVLPAYNNLVGGVIRGTQNERGPGVFILSNIRLFVEIFSSFLKSLSTPHLDLMWDSC